MENSSNSNFSFIPEFQKCLNVWDNEEQISKYVDIGWDDNSKCFYTLRDFKPSKENHYWVTNLALDLVYQGVKAVDRQIYNICDKYSFKDKIIKACDTFKTNITSLTLKNLNEKEEEAILKELIQLLNTTYIFQRGVKITKTEYKLPEEFENTQSEITDKILAILNENISKNGKLSDNLIPLCQKLMNPSTGQFLFKNLTLNHSPAAKFLLKNISVESLGVKVYSLVLLQSLKYQNDPALLEPLLKKARVYHENHCALFDSVDTPFVYKSENKNYFALNAAIECQSDEKLIKLLPYFPKDCFLWKDADSETPIVIALKENKNSEVLLEICKQNDHIFYDRYERHNPLYLFAQDQKYSLVLKELIKSDLMEFEFPFYDSIVFYPISSRGLSPLLIAIRRHTDPDLIKILLDMFLSKSIKNKKIDRFAKTVKVDGSDLIFHFIAKNAKYSDYLMKLIDLDPDILTLNNSSHVSVAAYVMEYQTDKTILKMLPFFPDDLFDAEDFKKARNNKRYEVLIPMTLHAVDYMKYLPSKLLFGLTLEFLDLTIEDALKNPDDTRFLFMGAILMFDIDLLLRTIKSIDFKQYDIALEGSEEFFIESVPRICLIEGYDEARRLLEKEPGKKAVIFDLLKDINNHTFTVEEPTNTLLHIIIEERPKDIDQIKLILEAGADPYLKNSSPESWSPYDWIMSDEKRISEFLHCIPHISKDYDELFTKSKIFNPESQFYHSIREGDIDALHTALNMKVNQTTLGKTLVNKQFKEGITNALHIAAQQENSKVIEILIKAGFNPNLTDEDGWTPLKVAAALGNKKAFEELSKRARPEKEKEASIYLKKEVTKEKIIYHNVRDLYLQDVSDKIKNWLAGGEVIDPVKMLKNKQALSEMILQRRELQTMLKHSKNATSKEIDQITLLIDSIPSVEALMQTALNQKPISESTVTTLKQNGATIDIKDENGHTALFHAIRAADSQKVIQLLDLGADLYWIKENPLSLLIHSIGEQIDASDNDRIACIKALMKAKVNINAKINDNGETSAHLIGKFGKLYTDEYQQEQVTSILVELIKAGVLKDLAWDLKDAKGKTGLDYCEASGNKALIAAINSKK